MAIEYTRSFWESGYTNTEQELTSFYERKTSNTDYNDAQIWVSNPTTRGDDTTESYAELLAGKKAFSDQVMSKTARTHKDLQMLAKGNNVPSDLMNDPVYQSTMKSLDNQKQLQFLKLYFDSYMAGMQSDIQWRLGNIKGLARETNLTDEKFGQLSNGAAFHRASMSHVYNWKYNNYDNIINTQRFYTSLGFPPYKIGAKRKLNKKTHIMDSVLAENPNVKYDQDEFKIKREYFPVRDVGMKSLSDYINYLQFILEGTTGIVSTYLTEWDLSVYIQEGLMTPKIGGGPMNIYLNYRIHDDNPLANTESGEYLDDKALAFNVCGSAVSKLFHDCTKIWRPSDYPQSSWWIPYIKDRDWKLHNLELKSLNQTIPYLSFYDTFNTKYNYDVETDIRKLIQHQDEYGLISSAVNNTDLHYYNAFYTSFEDGLSDYDVKLKNLMNAAVGLDRGVSSQNGVDIEYLKQLARKEMLMNGGYYGAPQQVGQNGGLFGRTAIEWAMDDGDDSSNITMSKMMKAAKKSGDENDVNFTQSTTDGVNGMTASILDTKKDASQTANYTGINRLSPTLYGGPHGADYSPLHLRDYFRADSVVSRNIPKVGPVVINSETDIRDDNNIEGFYKVEGGFSQSPSRAIKILKEGTYQYRTKLVYSMCDVNELIEGKVEFDKSTLTFKASLPEYINGSKVRYNDSTLFYKKKSIRFNPKSQLNSISEWDRFARKYGTSGYVLVNTPYCYGTYRKPVEKLTKIYEIDDRPDLHWNIVLHKFEKFKAPNTENGAFYRFMRSHKFSKWDDEAVKYSNEMGPGFVLTTNDKGQDDWLTNQIINYNRGLTESPKYYYFLGGGESDRYTEGPEYIFRCPIYVRYYKNVTTVYKKTFWIKTLDRIEYTYMPYLYAGLPEVVECYDLRKAPSDVISENSERVPPHLEPFSMIDGNSRSSPLQYLRTGFNHVITSYKQDKTEDNTFFALIAAFVILPLALAFTGGLIIASSAITAGIFSAMAGANEQKYVLGDGGGQINWRSTATIGISGIGMISGWQGLDPSCKPVNLALKNGYNEDVDFYNYVARSPRASEFFDTPISDLPLNVVHRANDISFKRELSPKFLAYMTENSPVLQKYSKTPADPGLKKAIQKICTQILFYPYDQGVSHFNLKLRVPYKNFHSYCMTEKNYLELSRDVFRTIDFANVRKLLCFNVDAAVLKACGLKRNNDDSFERVLPDTKHVLYNYWIDKAIQFFFTTSGHESLKSSINEKYDYLLSTLENTTSVVFDIIKKDEAAWTYNDIKKLNGELFIQQENTQRNIIDEFWLAYLNILYYYRSYFIAKRFNKQDGTMWTMRALESVVDLVVTNEVPPKNPQEMNEDKDENYAVAFYELQNTLDTKRAVIIDESHTPLQTDKVWRFYVKVDWCEITTNKDGSVECEAWKQWLAYRDDPDNNPKAREVLRFNVDGRTRFAYKPSNGLYSFRSKEFDKNEKNKVWNDQHPNEVQKPEIPGAFDCTFNIEWWPSEGKTPIRWNVFGSVNVDNLLQYSEDSISGQDLVCLTEEGADFWTITIPSNMWPEAVLYKKGLYIMRVEAGGEDIYSDMYTTVLGAMANSVSPIVEYEDEVASLAKSIQEGELAGLTGMSTAHVV